MTTRNELAEQRAGGLPSEEQQLYEAFRRMGMEPAAALEATRGRDTLPSTDPFEELTESFESMGLSRDSARVAAAGRDSMSPRQLRETLGAHEPMSSPTVPLPLPLTEKRLRELRRDPGSGFHDRAMELMETLPVRAALEQAERELVENYYGRRAR